MIASWQESYDKPRQCVEKQRHYPAEKGLYVKAMAGFGMVVFNELTNGVLPGYLYTPESLVTGGYETDTSMLGEKFGPHMVEAVLATVEKVK